MYLEEIVQAEGLENLNPECKAQLDRENVVEWLKTVAGFANAEGGSFFIGVEDKTNKLIGFLRREADNERNYFNNQVNEHLFPRPQMKLDFVRYQVNGTERYVIRAVIPSSVVKPVILKINNIPLIYMRRDGFTNGATYEEIIAMSIQSQKMQYDVLDSAQQYRREDITKLLAFYAEHNHGRELTDKALQSLGFYTKDGFLKNGAVLFTGSYHGEKTEVQCSLFSGLNKGSERVITVNRVKTNITDSIAYMMEFVQQRMNHSFIKLDSSRINIDAYPERALFEGIINAVAHRDYYLDGTQIQVDLFKDRLEISSPGSFYQGERFGKTYDLSGIISKRRNELICGILVECNVMEAAGTGFDKITEEYANADDTHKPYIYSTSDHFTLVLPDLTYEPGIIENNADALEYVPIPEETEHDKKVLAFCFYTARKANEIAEYLGISDSTYFRQAVLMHLTSEHYLDRDKSGRAYYYKTNREFVRLK